MIPSHGNFTKAAVLAVSLGSLAACGGQSAVSTSSPPTPAAPATAKASAIGQSSAQAPLDWNQIVAAGKQEGKVAIMGAVGADLAASLSDGFQKKYPEIRVEYSASSATEITAKLFTERQAGQYTRDLYLHGSRGAVSDLRPAGAIDSVQPFLVGPDARDESKWLGHKFAFADKDGKYNFVFISAVKMPLGYNPSQVSIADVRSYKDLLDPKWKGKMSMFDPRAGNTGLGMTTFWYVLPEFGKPFLEKLLAQDIALTKEDRQQLDWTARGQYPLTIGPSDHSLVELQAKGVPIKAVDANTIKEQSYLTSASGSMSIINKAPHPNATKLYVDWLLSKEGQHAVSKASGYPSRRTDVPTDHLESYSIPKDGVQYIENYTESFIKAQEEVQGFLGSLIP